VKVRRLAFVVREDGIALVMALVFMAVLLTVAGTVTYYATTNTRDAAFQAGNQKAFSAAEAGLNEAIAVLANVSNPTLSSTLPSSEATAVTDATSVTGSTIKYWGTYNAGTMTWTAYGKGTTPAPPYTARTVYEQVRIGAGGATVAGNPAWGSIFVDNKNGACFSIGSSVQISNPLYVTGNMCMSVSAKVTSSASPVTIGGTLQITDSASMGRSSGHIAVFHIGTGCRNGTSGSFTYPCTVAQSVYVDSPDQVVSNVTKPVIDMAGSYLNAKPGPNHACTSGSFPPGFDNDTTRNTSEGIVNIFPASAYDCVYSEGGSTVGELRWTPGNPGSLYIKGYVFIDGNIDLIGSHKIDLTGRGTIYANGYINIGGSEQLCAARSGSNCDYTTGAWDPEQKLLCWVAGSYASLSGSANVQGAIYAVTNYSQASSAHMQGPIVSTNMTMNASSHAPWLPFNTLADGMPGGSSAYSVAVLPGTWTG
jgi:uncharacterized protein (UPF0333 family)